MTLKFALFENHLTSDPNDYMAVVQDLPSKTQEDVIDLMIGRGSTVTRAEALSVNEEYSAAIVQLLKEGYAINTPIFNLSPSIKGVFYGADQSFNPASHSVKINISAGPRLREVGSQVNVEKVKGASPKPDIEYLNDFGSDTRNEQLTPGNIARIRGSRLKYDAADLVQGIYLIDTNGAETKVTTVVHNKPSQLDFLVPPLMPGEYKLEVRVVINKGKEAKAGALLSPLTVVESRR
ncbi:MAG: hypothetical protein US69_C0005G0003 [candidate division TM6 bacterium GW2011_GWF2_38_10]|nr:MAG: hypothetical protein US69_C0005G0003 [candidate division TM6 bacterium GW2011_GWF2_38_10]